MSRNQFAGLLAVVSIALLGALMVITPAAAHERRAVGDFWMVVGWKGEPALLNQPNALDLRVYRLKPGTDPAKQTAADRVPIEGLDKTLKAEVSLAEGGAKQALTIKARFGDLGAYDGLALPTKAGDYTFRVFGTVEGKDVNESFTSGPATFGTIQDTKEIQFPIKVSANQDLAARLDALEAQMKGGSSSSSAAHEDSDSSNTATILAVIALGVGAAGLGVGGFSLAKRK